MVRVSVVDIAVDANPLTDSVKNDFLTLEDRFASFDYEAWLKSLKNLNKTPFSWHKAERVNPGIGFTLSALCR